MDSHEHQTTSETKEKGMSGEFPFAPYMLPEDSYTGPEDKGLTLFNQKYAVRVASTPLTPEELELVRGHLEDIFHEEASLAMRLHDTFLEGWARNLGMAPAPQHQDIDSMKWFPDICDYANKHTAVYFVSGRSTHENFDLRDWLDHRHGYLDHRLGCYIYRKWHELHGGRPNLQRWHFFAKSLRLPESEAASWTIPSLVAAHRRLCDATAARLESEVVHLRINYPPYSSFPVPTETTRTWREHGLSLHYLFRAVILLADENVLPVECPVRPNPNISGLQQLQTVGPWLEQLMPECSVLLVRTGDDEHLSQPVSFEGLIKEGKTIPLGLEESKLANEFSVVRVKIDVAMRFLFDLQAQEEAATPRLREASAMLTKEREAGCHAWVESVLKHASIKEVGLDGNQFTWEAVRRMWAKRDGEMFDYFKQNETRLRSIKLWLGQF